MGEKKTAKDLGLTLSPDDILYYAETVAMYKADGWKVADAKMDVEMQMEENAVCNIPMSNSQYTPHN